MKKGTPGHPKTYDLASRLEVTRREAVGILEMLWHWAGVYCRRGDIGRHSPLAIAAGIDWQGDPGILIKALKDSGWLDECPCHTLRIHDWPDHADQSVKKSKIVLTTGFLECYESGKKKKSYKRSGSRIGRRHKADGIRQTEDGTGQTDGTAPLFDPENPRSVAAGYVAVFNAAFGRRCSVTAGVLDKVSGRLSGWKAWQIVAQPLLVFANTGDAGFRDQVMPEWPLRDGKHPRTTADGRTNGGTDWLEREYNRADRTVFDERLSQIARDAGVLDKLTQIGVRVRGAA